jgi:hypothetical protein
MLLATRWAPKGRRAKSQWLSGGPVCVGGALAGHLILRRALLGPRPGAARDGACPGTIVPGCAAP